MSTRTIVVLFACLCVAGCEDSQNPLSDPQCAKSDNRLVGLWRVLGEDGDVGYYHIGQPDEKLPSGVLRVVEVTHNRKGKLSSPEEFLAFSTTLGDKTYLNVTDVKGHRARLIEENGWKPETVDSYIILRYQVDGNGLLVWMMDAEAKERAIETGKVNGKIAKKGKSFDGPAKFTDTSERLARFVIDAGDSLFVKKPLRFERVEEPKK
ncbi:MAG: hypothetical protein WCJ35_27520 [Planctomycetota bacterium]